MTPNGQNAGSRLHVGRSTTLVHALREELKHCASASFAVAFVIETGLDLLEGELRAAALRGATIRMLTSDYLGVTEPSALRDSQDRAHRFSEEIAARRVPLHPGSFARMGL